MKRNRFIRFISLVLAVLFLFGGSVTAFADDEPGEEEPGTETQEEEAVARIYICSRKNSWWQTGHVFVYLENLSEETLTVGVYELPPEEGVSIGSFGFTKSDGFGVYFNIEAYIYNTYGDENILCLSDELTAAELEKLSHRLLYSNTWDFVFFNCAAFALMLWNTVASPFLMPMLFPAFCRLQIKMHGGEASPKFFYPAEDHVYRLRGTGEHCHLEQVSEKSISK